MIFVVYSRPEPGREGGNVTKEFKLVLESVKINEINTGFFHRNQRQSKMKMLGQIQIVKTSNQSLTRVFQTNSTRG